MPTPPIALVFTDLDNTLYDWVAWYSRAFYRLVGQASRRAGVARRHLLVEMRALHRARNRLEEPEALLHAPSVQQAFGDTERARHALAPAFEAYYHAKNHGRDLRAYPGVRATLQRCAAAGVMVIGHTEAPANHAVARLRTLGLEHAFVALMASAPAADDPTLHRGDVDDPPFPVLQLSPEHNKPNPVVLRRWCERCDLPPDRALFVGDSLERDMRMAAAAGLRTAWARYGTDHDPRDWQDVVRVSPWSTERCRRAQAAIPPADLCPDAVLRHSFDEVLDQFEFDGHAAARPALRPLELAAQ